MYDDRPYQNFSGQINQAIRKHASGFSEEDRKDIRQDILLAFFESDALLIAQYKQDEDKARGLAYTIARNAIVNKMRQGADKVSRRAVSLDDPNIQSGLSRVMYRGAPGANKRFFGELAEAVADKSPDIDVDRALASLPEDEQTVIRAIFFEGRAQEEIAKEMGQSRHWVRLKKDSALAELKRLLRN